MFSNWKGLFVNVVDASTLSVKDKCPSIRADALYCNLLVKGKACHSFMAQCHFSLTQVSLQANLCCAFLRVCVLGCHWLFRGSGGSLGISKWMYGALLVYRVLIKVSSCVTVFLLQINTFWWGWFVNLCYWLLLCTFALVIKHVAYIDLGILSRTSNNAWWSLNVLVFFCLLGATWWW